MIDNLRGQLRAWIATLEFGTGLEKFLEAAIGLGAVLLLTLVVQRILRLCVARISRALVKRLATEHIRPWTDALQDRLFARHSAHIVSSLIMYVLAPQVLEVYPRVAANIQHFILAYVVIVTAIAINSLIGAAGDVWSGERRKEQLPIRIAAQAAQGIVSVVAGIVALSFIFDTSVTVMLSGLAGMTVLLMLLFKDSILGFAAGIQLSGNDMLRIGDWIDIPQFGAEGTVQDVRLTTVKVRNFDKTISTIPTYALVSQSFKNWHHVLAVLPMFGRKVFQLSATSIATH